MNLHTIVIDGQKIPFRDGQTIMEAATAAGIYIPHLCHNPEFKPHGSCKLCTVKVNGRNGAACTFHAAIGQEVQNNTEELNAARRSITEMLFVAGNHICPYCEKSGDCQLQAMGYFLGMMGTQLSYFYSQHDLDASHPDVLLDRDRCILCELCVRASRDVDGKNVFTLSGRGFGTRLIVNSSSGLLKDSSIEATDKAVDVCPVGALLVKRKGFQRPIGERVYDQREIDEVSLEYDQAIMGGDHG